MSEVRYQTSAPVPEYSGDRTRKEGELAMSRTTFRPVALPLMRLMGFAWLLHNLNLAVSGREPEL